MQQYFDEIVRQIQALVKFDSSLSAPTKNAPFGEETAKCLAYFLALAEKMGFEVHNYDNYAGEVIFGEGEPFAVLAHLDVVPSGGGWTHDPFGGEIADGKLFGRGTMDDKGPALICLYALYALKQKGVAPRRRFKLIVGCNEESGWKCMEHYKQVAVMPNEGFTPDADFPVIYAEKGIAHLRLTFPVKNNFITDMGGGSAANMVCDHAWAKGDFSKFDEYTNPVPNTSLRFEKGVLTARGVSAHGSTPEKGASALQALLRYLSVLDKDLARAYEILFEDSLGLKTVQDETGRLTLSPNVAQYGAGKLSVTVDIRYPATHTLREVTDRLQKAALEYTVIHTQDPLYNDKNGKLIQTLTGVYNRVTGQAAKPIAIGGGTYARALPLGCGFGPQEEGEEVTIHQPNEYITLEKIKKLSEIYYQALCEIGK